MPESPVEAIRPYAPDSAMWRINRERVVLLGGASAAVLQAAHPQVALGVARHSAFQHDSAGRLRRTLQAVYDLAFGSAEEIAAVRERVARKHSEVKGAGYSAFDPDAQLWVLATLIQTSLTLYQRFVRPLTPADRDRFLADNRPFGSFFGLDPAHVPTSWAAFEVYWHSMLDGDLLGSHPLCAEVANAVIRPRGPRHMRLLSPIIHALALEYIPQPLRQRLHMPPSKFCGPLWWTLDRIVPPLLPLSPSLLRHPAQYRRARRRMT